MHPSPCAEALSPWLPNGLAASQGRLHLTSLGNWSSGPQMATNYLTSTCSQTLDEE
jgi:hypothetical protein